jgi:hypothetical protein
LSAKLNAFLCGSGFGDHGEAGIVIENEAPGFANQFVVINDDKFNLAHWTRFWLTNKV